MRRSSAPSSTATRHDESSENGALRSTQGKGIGGRQLREREEGAEEAQDLGLGGKGRQGEWPPSGQCPAVRRVLESPLSSHNGPLQTFTDRITCDVPPLCKDGQS
jgi:hypothetical protein